jgi:hypothetical protein
VVSDIAGQDYAGTMLTFSISGYIKNILGIPAEGVSVTAQNGGGTDTTDANGFYKVGVDYNWSGTVTPGKAEYTMVPAKMIYTNVLSDRLNQDYLAVNIYDLDCNGSIGNSDLARIAENWLKTAPPVTVEEGDFNDDKTVNLLDFAMFAQHWLEGT